MSEELNRKLAEWAEFYLSDVKVVYRYKWDKREPCWLNPNGTVAYGITGRGSYPNFSSSLNACFKWLVPPLLKDGWQITIHIDRDGVCVHIQKPRVGNYSSEGTELAPALCKAIEQLIDKEVKDESR